ncbi:DNA-binding protein [Candidatus Sumerlaeota bacterium]|nr:DNA-binding protein [Candidatus Sumerlaeota bacterium]
MTTITIPLADEQLTRLRDAARRLNVAPEELARVGIEDLLARSDEALDHGMDYILRKNAELYRRLA